MRGDVKINNNEDACRCAQRIRRRISSKMVMRVLIVGAGIGGLTLAAFLRDSDIEYEIVEKAPDWSRQGFLIGMWDSGRDILKKLGLSEQFDKSGSPVRRYSMRNGKGTHLHDFDFSDFYVKYGSAMTVIRRNDLHDWLLQKIDQSKLRMGISVENIVQNPERVTVTFGNGGVKDYDVVVGGDGVHSSVRSQVFGKHIESYQNWRVWYGWVDAKFGTPATIIEYVEPGEFAAIFTACGKAMVWLSAPAEHGTWDNEKGRIARLKEIFKDEKEIMPGILDAVLDENMLPTDLVTLKLKKWYEGRVVLVGDAAHNFGPHAGVGGGMALEDAYVLAGELMKVSNLLPLSVALQNYQIERGKRLRYARGLSDRVRGATLIKSRFLRKLLDAVIPYAPARFFTKNLELLLKQEI